MSTEMNWPKLVGLVLASGVIGGGGAGFGVSGLTDYRLKQVEKKTDDLDRQEEWGAMKTRVESLERQVREQWKTISDLRSNH